MDCIAKDNDAVRVVDLLPEYQANEDRYVHLLLDEVHPNARGHQVIAERLSLERRWLVSKTTQ